MKKTQKLISLVVVLAFALSLCSISAFAKKEIISTTIDENLVTADFATDQTLSAGKTTINTTGTSAVKAGAVANASISGGALVATGRIILDLSPTVNSGTYSVSFRFKTEDTDEQRAGTNIYRAGSNLDIFGSGAVATTVKSGVETIGSITITPGEWYDFECVIDLDQKTTTSSIEGVVVATGATDTPNANDDNHTLGRIIDANVASGRTIYYDDLAVNKVTQIVRDDSVTNIVTGNFSATQSAAISQFNDAAGISRVSTDKLFTNASTADGILSVGTSTGDGRLLLKSASDIKSGTYTTEFEFRFPEAATEKQGRTVYGMGENNSHWATTATGTTNVGGVGYERFSFNGKEVVIESGEWYSFKATFNVVFDETTSTYSGKYTATVDDVVVDVETYSGKTNPVKRLFDYGGTNVANRQIDYRNLTINSSTRDYAVEDIKIENGKISARFLSNVAPNATFFVAIKEDGVLKSLKAISDYNYFETKEVGSYDTSKDVDVKFYVWANKKGLMPLAAPVEG